MASSTTTARFFLWAMALLFLPQLLAAQDLQQIGKGKPVTISGSIGAEGVLTGQSGAAPVPSVSTLGLNANLNFNIYGIDIPLSATYYNRGFAYAHPFERYGISPHYKWITLHAGWRNVAFSPLVFSGISFLGGGIELRPGRFHFGAVYGIFNQARREDTVQNPYSFYGRYTQPSYRRTGYAFKIGYGTAKTFFDIVLFRAKDDTSSIPRPVADTRQAPQQNSAAAISYRQALGKHLSFTLNTALSLFTRDLRSDTIPADYYGAYSDISHVQSIRYSTQLSYAGDATLAWRGKQLDWRIAVRRLSPLLPVPRHLQPPAGSAGRTHRRQLPQQDRPLPQLARADAER